jgi:hypothetical protein
MAAYLNRELEKLDRLVQEIMNVDEPIVLDNPIFEAFEHDPDAFFTLCEFEVERSSDCSVSQKRINRPETWSKACDRADGWVLLLVPPLAPIGQSDP